MERWEVYAWDSTCCEASGNAPKQRDGREETIALWDRTGVAGHRAVVETTRINNRNRGYVTDIGSHLVHPNVETSTEGPSRPIVETPGHLFELATNMDVTGRSPLEYRAQTLSSLSVDLPYSMDGTAGASDGTVHEIGGRRPPVYGSAPPAVEHKHRRV